jgi:hypothetical protein
VRDPDRAAPRLDLTGSRMALHRYRLALVTKAATTVPPDDVAQAIRVKHLGRTSPPPREGTHEVRLGDTEAGVHLLGWCASYSRELDARI